MPNAIPMSPQLNVYILEGIAKGLLSPVAFASHVQATIPVAYKHLAAHFEKEGRGRYTVVMYRDGVRVAEEGASTPIEAKLLLIDYLAKGIHESLEERKEKFEMA